jgi:hypothetical protein
MQEVVDVPPPLPASKNTWTFGTVLTATTSVVSLLATLITVVWFAAKLDTVTQHVPSIQQRQQEQDRSIAVLQDQQHYTDIRYAEIMAQLAAINQKLDNGYAENSKRQ